MKIIKNKRYKRISTKKMRLSIFCKVLQIIQILMTDQFLFEIYYKLIRFPISEQNYGKKIVQYLINQVWYSPLVYEKAGNSFVGWLMLKSSADLFGLMVFSLSFIFMTLFWNSTFLSFGANQVLLSFCSEIIKSLSFCSSCWLSFVPSFFRNRFRKFSNMDLFWNDWVYKLFFKAIYSDLVGI